MTAVTLQMYIVKESPERVSVNRQDARELTSPWRLVTVPVKEQVPGEGCLSWRWAAVRGPDGQDGPASGSWNL